MDWVFYGDVMGLGMGRADVPDALTPYPPYICAGHNGHRIARAFEASLRSPGGSDSLIGQ